MVDSVIKQDMPNDPASRKLFFDALEKQKTLYRSTSHSFIERYRDWIVDGLKAGYSVAQMYRGMSELKLMTSTGRRQFYRDVARIKQQSILPFERSGKPTDRQAVMPSTSADPSTGSLPILQNTSAASQAAGGNSDAPRQEVPVFKLKTFQWNPETAIDDLH